MNRNQLLFCLLGVVACLVTSSVARVALINGIKENNVHDLPYMVSVKVRDHGHFCGGAIVREKYILTAAHCVVDDHNKPYKDFTVHAGTVDLHKGSIEIYVEKAFIPNEYHPPATSSTGDIAVLRLKDSVNLKHIKVATGHNKYVHEKVKISGFGWNEVEVDKTNQKEKGKTDGLLRYRDAKVLDTKHCNEGWPHRTISEKQICARMEQHGDEHRGVCTADSGGPLVHDGKTVIGVLSISAIGCSEKKSAAIYTRVTEYSKFISYALGDKKVEVPGGVREIQL